jgi:hypothetical protein
MRKIEQLRRYADACEACAASTSHPQIQQRWLDLAKEWREMADRFEPFKPKAIRKIEASEGS